MAANLASDKFWTNKNLYHDAEKKYHENLAKLHKRGQRGEEVGENADLANAKKVKKLGKKNVAKAVEKEHVKCEAEGHLNKNFDFDKVNCVSGLMQKDEPDCLKANLIIPEKVVKKKEKSKKKSKSLKKGEKIKEKDDLLQGGVGMTKLNQDTFPKTALAGEVAKAIQHIKSSLECMGNLIVNEMDCAINPRLCAILEKMEKSIENLTERVAALELKMLRLSDADDAHRKSFHLQDRHIAKNQK